MNRKMNSRKIWKAKGMVNRGFLNKEIAVALGVTVQTLWNNGIVSNKAKEHKRRLEQAW